MTRRNLRAAAVVGMVLAAVALWWFTRPPEMVTVEGGCQVERAWLEAHPTADILCAPRDGQ
jgi:hypothetical protein